MATPITKEQLTDEQLDNILEMASDASRLYGPQWDSALVGGVGGNFHAVTSDTIQAVVVQANDDSRDASWLCDYLESVSPGVVISALRELQERRKAAMNAEPDYGLHRDANRYRFLRDKDAFGDEDAPDFASWSDLAELDAGEFDSAVDARLLNCEIPQYILNDAQERTATAGVYAELYRLRAEIKGPDGFDTWKDAAIAERKSRVELEKSAPRVGDVDYLGAMAAFHSDEWHKMGPITGYMRGWNACRAAMLQSFGNSEQLEPVTTAHKLPKNSFTDADLEMMAHGDNPQSNAYRELLAFRRNSPVIQDGWKLVPVIAFPSQWAAGQKAFESAGMNKVDAVYKAMIAAAPQQEAK